MCWEFELVYKLFLEFDLCDLVFVLGEFIGDLLIEKEFLCMVNCFRVDL